MRIPHAQRFAFVVSAILLVSMGGCTFPSQAPTATSGIDSPDVTESPTPTVFSDKYLTEYQNGTLDTKTNNFTITVNGKGVQMQDGIYKLYSSDKNLVRTDVTQLKDADVVQMKGTLVDAVKTGPDANGQVHYYIIVAFSIHGQNGYVPVDFSHLDSLSEFDFMILPVNRHYDDGKGNGAGFDFTTPERRARAYNTIKGDEKNPNNPYNSGMHGYGIMLDINLKSGDTKAVDVVEFFYDLQHGKTDANPYVQFDLNNAIYALNYAIAPEPAGGVQPATS